jgi:hypothetical protein
LYGEPAGYRPLMTIFAATHAHGLGWGIGLIVIGVLHLAFRGFYARRSAAIETARQETAPRAFKGRGLYVTGRNANMLWIIGSSVVFIVVGIILIATHA